MEPEVHIIEKYFQEMLRCFTMTNIQCVGRKEIDLLAINPIENKRYHVEARVSTSFPLRLRETKTKSGKSHKNGVDYFAREKFGHPHVLEKVKQFFGNENYERILVVYRIHGEDLTKKELHACIKRIKAPRCLGASGMNSLDFMEHFSTKFN